MTRRVPRVTDDDTIVRNGPGGDIPDFDVVIKPDRTESAKRRRDVLGRLERLLAEQDINLDEVGAIEKLRVNEWEVVTKGIDGKPTKTKAHAAAIVINPSWSTGPEWPLPQPARPLTVRVPAARTGPTLLRGYRTALVEPDPQIGFLRAPDGRLLPIHDPRALDVAEMIGEAERPDDWVNLGDYFDLAEMSTFRQEPGFAMTVQPTIEEGYRHAATQRAVTKRRAWVHEGNHDQRFVNYLIDNSKAAFGLRRANEPDSWPVLSIPYLLRFDELGIEYADGYPATWRYINENVATTHGTYTSTKTSSAASKYVEAEMVSVIFGHDHTAQTVYKTRNTRTHKVQTFAHSSGCLCRTDGFVPGGGKYRGRKADGLPTRSWQNWQNGVTVVRYVPGDGPVEIEHVVIDEGVATHRGQRFVSKKTVPRA